MSTDVLTEGGNSCPPNSNLYLHPVFQPAPICEICSYEICLRTTTYQLVAHFINIAPSPQVCWVVPEQGLGLGRFGPLLVVAERGDF